MALSRLVAPKIWLRGPETNSVHFSLQRGFMHLKALELVVQMIAFFVGNPEPPGNSRDEGASGI